MVQISQLTPGLEPRSSCPQSEAQISLPGYLINFSNKYKMHQKEQILAFWNIAWLSESREKKKRDDVVGLPGYLNHGSK